MFRGIGIALGALALGGCGLADDGGTRDQIRAVGSSTVYPFTTAMAELFPRRLPRYKAPIVEANGTGGGMKLFCAGIGARYPDIADASRRMKASEAADCRRNGVADVVELQIGIDGIALAENAKGPGLSLTRAQIYRALAAEPFGRPNTAHLWSDIDRALPAIPILVYGPPPSSGTRDAFAELVMTKGCESDPAMKALKTSDEKRHKAVCTRIREDGAFVEAGENDNLIAQKLDANRDALGIFGYSFLEENPDRLRGLPVEGVAPAYATIADYSYPGARPLYIYVKRAHLDAVPGLRAFVAQYAASWAPGGYLDRRGLIASPADVRAKADATAAAMAPMDMGTLK